MTALPVACSLMERGPSRAASVRAPPGTVHVGEENSSAAVVGVFEGIPQFVFQRRGDHDRAEGKADRAPFTPLGSPSVRTHRRSRRVRQPAL
jgi:hypothetical protein